MAKISNTESYPFQSPIEGADYLIGTAANSTTIPKQTKTFTISGISNFVIDAIGPIGTVTSVSGAGSVSGLTLTGTVTSAGSLTLGGSLILTSSQITTGLGFTPYNATNPNGYTNNVGTVTSVGLSSDVTAFAVGSSPITSSGTISLNITGGTSGQFLRQDGNWATVPATDLTGYQITSEKGNADGYAPLDANNKVPTVHLPAAIVGSVIYKGTFDAAPPSTLPDPTTVKGDYYVVSNPGTYLGIAYALGDWIISNGANWQKVDNSAGVNSVNGATGTVLLNLANLGDVTGGTTAGQVLTRNANNTYDFQTPDPGVGTTDLTNTTSETEVTVNSSTGNNTSIAAASATIAGVMTSADKTKLDKAIIGTTVDQTAIVEINTLTQDAYDTLDPKLANVMYVISSGNTPEPPEPVVCSYTFTSNGELVQAVNLWTGTPAQRDIAEDTYGHISNWCFTEGVNSMSQLFQYKSDFNDDISGWDVSNVRFMQNMFEGALAFNSNISSWDVSNVTNVSWMFANAWAFNQPIGDWVLSPQTAYNMFSYAQNFNNGYTYGTSDVENVLNWDVSSLTTVRNMFDGASAFNGDLSSWDVSNVTSMSEMRNMFDQASSFNQDISSWCVTNIDSEPIQFSYESPLAENHKPIWGTCPQ